MEREPQTLKHQTTLSVAKPDDVELMGKGFGLDSKLTLSSPKMRTMQGTGAREDLGIHQRGS